MFVPLTATRPEVYFSTMTKFISDPHEDLEKTLNHLNSIKLKSYPRGNVEAFATEFLVNTEILESSGDFKLDKIG